MTTNRTSLQTTSKPSTKCDTCIHRLDLDHDCKAHRCVMSEVNGYMIVHECTGYRSVALEVENARTR